MSHHCRWCGQQIRWVRTVSGANMCLDPDPSLSGNVALTAHGARALKADELLNWPGRLWMPHVVTCSHVGQTGGKRTI